MSPDVHTLTGAYAVHALDAAESELFEGHLRECQSCWDEVRELTATSARLAEAVSEPAPPGLRERVLAAVTRTRQDAPDADVVDLAARRRWYQAPATAAAAFLLVVAGGLGVFAASEQRQAEQAEERAARIAAIATDPDRFVTSIPAISGGRAHVAAADGSVVFHTTGLPLLPEDRVYQLWLIEDGHSRSAGVLGNGSELAAFVEDMGSAESLGVTVEPVGGSTQPSDELVLRVEMA